MLINPSPARDLASNPPIRIVIIAAYPAIRAGLHALLAEQADAQICVADEMAGASDLEARLVALRPDVILLDVLGGGEGGAGNVTLAALLSLLTDREDSGSSSSRGRSTNGGKSAADANNSRTVFLPAALVVLGEHPQDDLPLLMSATLPGYAYLLREADGTQIAQAIRAAHAGLVVYDRSLSLALPGSLPEASPLLSLVSYRNLPGETLTAREMQVLQLMADGLPNKTIAYKLGISLHTAKFHVAQILGKLQATSRTEAVTLGARRGLILL